MVLGLLSFKNPSKRIKGDPKAMILGFLRSRKRDFDIDYIDKNDFYEKLFEINSY